MASAMIHSVLHIGLLILLLGNAHSLEIHPMVLRLELHDRLGTDNSLVYSVAGDQGDQSVQVLRGGLVIASATSSDSLNQLSIFQGLIGIITRDDLAGGESKERAVLRVQLGEDEMLLLSVWMTRDRLVSWLSLSPELAVVLWDVEDRVAKENKIRGVSGMSGGFLDVPIKKGRK